MDILTEERVYPCEPATAEEFSREIWEIAGGYSDAGRTLRRITCGITEDDIPWSVVSTLSIIGNANNQCNRVLAEAGLKSGIYINRTGDRLLLIRPRKPAMEQYLAGLGTQLKELELYHSTFRRLDLSSLTALERLYVFNNGKLESLNGLDQLTNLSSLNLSGCSSLTQLPGLEKLVNLSSLNLSGCSSLIQLPGLDKLTNLSLLNLSWCISLTQLPRLDKLTNLSLLNLSWCIRSLTQLPELEKLTNLSSLDLSQCTSLIQLPGLEKLTNLSSLNLDACIKLTQLSGLEKLTNLSSLHLSGCRSLTQLPGLDKLTNLSSLDLSWCSSLGEIPQGLNHIKALRKLDLRHMKLRTLPDWLPEIAEQFSMSLLPSEEGNNRAIVYLYGTTVDDIPDMSIFDQPYEMVVKWFEDRKRGKTRKLNEIKVVFLGDGEAGKSHTIARLMNDGGEPDHLIFDEQSTPGIVIRNKEYDLEDRKIQVHYWDFGGQEIMHSMHRIFLTGRTMYVVLLNARDDTQGDRARYWLHNIKSFAPNAPVLLVLNKIDQNANASVDEKDLRSRYEKLTQVVKLSAKDFTQAQFNTAFTRVLLEEIKKTGFLDAQWPIEWTQIKDELEHMTGHYIFGDAYADICKAHEVDKNQKDLLLWFNDLGISFCCCGEDD